MRLGVKFYENGSTYKRALLGIKKRSRIVGAQLAGDFTLPQDNDQKLVFIAGGIGITPFRSMIKYLVDTNDRRDLVLFYSNKHEDEIIYSDVFNEAYKKLGIRTIYTLTDTSNVPQRWKGATGRINPNMIKHVLPDFMERIYFLSGPHTMVEATRDTLLSMGINKNQIKTDYFPGLV